MTEGTYEIIVKTREEQDRYLNILKTFGIHPTSEWTALYKYMIVIPRIKYVSANNYYKGKELVTIGELIDILIKEESEVALIKISDNYTAEITKDGIKVGCQEISLETFDKIANAVKRIRG